MQATKSNYSRIHRGKTIPYLEYFLKRNRNFSIQTEQAFRYFNKKLKCSFLCIKKIDISKKFRWFSKIEINNLLKKKFDKHGYFVSFLIFY